MRKRDLYKQIVELQYRTKHLASTKMKLQHAEKVIANLTDMVGELKATVGTLKRDNADLTKRRYNHWGKIDALLGKPAELTNDDYMNGYNEHKEAP